MDLIAGLLQKSAESKTPDFTLVNAVQGFHNPRLIPTLIGLLEAMDTTRPGFNPYDNTLRQLTQIPWNGSMADREHDGLWWRIWWHDNKKRYAPEVQKVSIPHSIKRTRRGAVRRSLLLLVVAWNARLSAKTRNVPTGSSLLAGRRPAR